MGKVEEYKPEMAMIGLQLCYAGLTLCSRATLVHGTSPRVFILYRQAFATMCIFPVLYLSRRKSNKAIISPLDLKSFSLIFMVSLVGITVYQNLYFEGLYLASSSMGSAMVNIVPAITFLISFLVGYEKVNFQNIRGLAKMVGTILCVAGALSMTLIRGSKIFNSESDLPIAKCVLGDFKEQDMWFLGCLFLLCSTLSWSFWLIIQVPISAYYPDHHSLSAWMCLFGTLQCAVVTFFLEKDPNAWILHSYSEFATCLYAGVVTSALSFTVQAWVISERGPLFTAMFNPLCTVIVTILASLFLQEDIYTGSLIGGFCVIMGLYIVLWGKAKDLMNQEQEFNNQNSEVKINIDDSSITTICNSDLKNPLLSRDGSTRDSNN